MKYKALFYAYAALVFLAYMQPLDQSVFTPNRFGKTLPLTVQGIYLVAWLAPVLPLIVAALVLLGLRLIPSAFAKVLAVFSITAGLFLTLASGVFSLSSTTQLLHGLTLTVAVVSSFLIWSGRDGAPQPSRTAKLGIAAATIAALWSLLTVPMIVIQAHVIADGSPYCIAEHSPDSPVETLHELRGFAFYTTNTGYKSTSEWFFHGLMVVDQPDGKRVYNWSPRRWRFDLVTRPDILIKPVRNVCAPR